MSHPVRRGPPPRPRPPQPEGGTVGSFAPQDYPLLPFVEADWQWCCTRAQELGLPDVQPLREQATAVYSHLVGVNAWLNLTRLTSPRDWLKQHFLDSLCAQLAPAWRELDPDGLCIDLGTGGGYPGLPLLLTRPTQPWRLIDSRGRKVQFVAAALPLTGATRAQALHLRGHEAPAMASELVGRCALVTARAVGQADELLREMSVLLRPGGRVLLLKGPGYLGDEHERTMATAVAMRFMYEGTVEVVLENGDPARLLPQFRKT